MVVQDLKSMKKKISRNQIVTGTAIETAKTLQKFVVCKEMGFLDSNRVLKRQK